MTRYRLDSSWQRPGDGRLVLAGSPLRLFRLSASGAGAVSDIEQAALDGIELVRTPAVQRLVDRFVSAGALHPVHSTPPFTVSDVTVVVPYFADHAMGVPVLPPSLQAVVVDDASPVAPAVPPAVRVVRRSENGGPGAARNTGLAEVSTPVVVFIDSDVVLPDGDEWLVPLLAHFADPDVAVVAPRVRSLPAARTIARYEATHSPLDLGDEPARVVPGGRVSYVPAAVLVCRTEAIRALRGFDVTLRFGEDVDLVWRAVAAGHVVRYEPIVEVWHQPRASWRAWVRQRVAYGSSAAPLALRHRGALAPVRMNGWSAAVWLLFVASQPVAAVLLAAGTVVAMWRKVASLPKAVAARIVIVGHLAAGRQLATAVRRVWWPIALVAALLSRTARRAVLLALLAPIAQSVWKQRSSPAAVARALREAPFELVDDAAYGAGVWWGVARAKRFDVLLPSVTRWPQRGDG